MGMKVQRFVRSLVVAAGLVVNVVAVNAQDYRILVMGGGSVLFDKKYYSVDSRQFGSTYKSGGVTTIGAEIPLKKLFRVDASYDFLHNKLVGANYTNGLGALTSYNIRHQRVSGDLLFYVPKSVRGVKSFRGAKPYLVAGPEYDRFSPTRAAKAVAQYPGFNGYTEVTLSPVNKLGYNYGAGLEMKLTRTLHLRLDVRDHVTGSPTYGVPSASTSGVYFPISGAAHDLQYTAGFIFNMK
jgi:opacity protein-like surface antigen